MTDFNNKLARIAFGTFACVVVAFALAALMAGTGVVSAEETDWNETVDVDNDTESIAVDIDWNDSIESSATADVEIFNATEYEDDPENATALVQDSVTGVADVTTETEFNVTEGAEHELENGTYEVIVTGDDTEVDEVYVAALGPSSGGVAAATDAYHWLIGNNNPYYVGGATVLLLVAGLVARRAGWL